MESQGKLAPGRQGSFCVPRALSSLSLISFSPRHRTLGASFARISDYVTPIVPSRSRDLPLSHLSPGHARCLSVLVSVLSSRFGQLAQLLLAALPLPLSRRLLFLPGPFSFQVASGPLESLFLSCPDNPRQPGPESRCHFGVSIRLFTGLFWGPFPFIPSCRNTPACKNLEYRPCLSWHFFICFGSVPSKPSLSLTLVAWPDAAGCQAAARLDLLCFPCPPGAAPVAAASPVADSGPLSVSRPLLGSRASRVGESILGCVGCCCRCGAPADTVPAGQVTGTVESPTPSARWPPVVAGLRNHHS